MSIGPNLEFVITQDSQPFVETSIGLTLPLLPFNNYIWTTFDAQAFVNLDPTKTFDQLPPDFDFSAQPY